MQKKSKSPIQLLKLCAVGLLSVVWALAAYAAGPVSVSLQQPVNGQIYTAPVTIDMIADASSTTGTIVLVEFLDGTAVVGNATAAPYELLYSIPSPGRHVLKARATDSNGKIATSAAVTVQVTGLPSVTLTAPQNNALVIAPGSVTVRATATEANGQIASVTFTADGETTIATLTAAPYTFNWTNVQSGTYNIVARAVDTQGNFVFSNSATIRVDTPPTVSLASPVNGAVFSAKDTITLRANAFDADGQVTKVDFFRGGTLIGTSTAGGEEGFTVTWASAPGGNYVLTAVATDNLGVKTTSSPVTISVDTRPRVSLTAPANLAVLPGGGNVTLAATVTDSVGAITRVDFMQGGTLIGSANAAPYTVQWASVPAGNYVLTAIATNDAGQTRTSSAVRVTVFTPTVSLTAPAANASFAAPATIALAASATDSNGTITQVDFYQGTTLIGSATSAPYTFQWSNVAPGLYSLTAVATDNQGAIGTSAPVAVKVYGPPTVALTTPQGGTQFRTPATITLVASAQDIGANIAKVDFYQGSTLLGTASTPPYAFTWGNVAQGTYALSAVATNNFGQSTASSPVAVTVSTLPAQVYYTHPDHLNTPRAITDQMQNVVWSWDQAEPFGNNPVNEDSSSGAPVLSYNPRFPGQYFDAETNLHYNYFRDYDPGIGRYVQSDALGLLASLNTYSYVDAAPTVVIDPLGLMGQGSGARSSGHWADCAPADWKYCNKLCGDRGVKSCKVWISIHTELINGQIIRGPKKGEPSCNCNDCPDPSPSGRRSPSGLGDDADELLGDNNKRKQSMPMFSPLPIWRYILP